jgi:beta-mannosidase
VGEALLSDAFWFPAGLSNTRESDIGLSAEVLPHDADGALLRLTTRRFAQSIAIDAAGFVATDNGFHLAPGQVREIMLRRKPAGSRTGARGSISALNATSSVGVALP